jgi:hypothetical protein
VTPRPFPLFAALLLALTACGDEQTGTHIGNPTAGFALTVVSTEPSAPAGRPTFRDDGGLVYTLSHARTYVRDIELYLPVGTTCADIAAELAGATCGPDESGGFKLDIRGPFVVDLVARETTPRRLETVRLPALTYRRVDVRIDEGDPDDGVISASDELNERSLVARADFEYQGVAVVLEVALRFNEDVRFEDPSGVAVSEAQSLLAELDAAAWLEGLALGDCLDDGELVVENGRLVIDDRAGSGECSDVEGRVRANVEASGRLAVGAAPAR